jgi:4-amino-4-deoxy-L-arabinose transferase-like glycosyltransferase
MQDKHSSIKPDLLMAGALTLVGVLMRMPYLALIPVFEDEVMQTVYALSIRPGEFMPLVGNDAYAGPLFSYLIAVSMRVFGSTPITPRVVVMVIGALTVGATYWLARSLGLSRPWAALAGLLMAANPHHILINSHYAGATYIVPLFSTAFLAALALAVKNKSGAWLVAAGALLGLALQATPVPVLMLPGVGLWFLAQRKSGIGLRTRWPYLAMVAFVLAYAPVIVYNVQTHLVTVQVAQSRTYVWQPNLSFAAYAQNLGRLMLQLCRQVSGVLEGDTSFTSLIGLPLVLSAWSGIGLVYAARCKSSLPVAAVASQALIMPWLSSSYGMVAITRYTSQLTPLLLVAMAMLAAGVWNWLSARAFAPALSEAEGSLRASSQPLAAALHLATCILLVALSLWPLTRLWQYYDHAVARGETNVYQLAFGDELVRQWHGEKILIADSPDKFIFIGDAWSEFNATEYLLAVNHIPYTVMPIGRLLEHLATGQETGRVILILHNDDLTYAQSQADLIAWDSPAMQISRQRGYDVYTIADTQRVCKPTFVFSDTTLAPTVRPVQVNLADQLALIGYEPKGTTFAPGDTFVVNLYWKSIGAMPETYTGFLHLIAADGHLATQDDHELGRGFYRTLFWQPGEIVRERYELNLPGDIPPGDYVLRAGAYSFPSLTRLAVLTSSVPAQDNTIMLDTIHVGP